MKKIYTNLFTAMAVIGSVTLATTSCSDSDNDFAKQVSTQQNTVSNDAFNGNFTTVNVDPVTRLGMKMTISDQSVTLMTYDADSTKESANVKGVYLSDGKVLKAEPNINGIKTFTLEKVGTSFYEMKAEMSDGSQKEFGFALDNLSTRAAAGDEPMTKDDSAILYYIERGLHTGLEFAINQIPVVGGLASGLVSKIPFLVEDDKDMSVKDCYSKCSAAQERMELKIDKLLEQGKTLNYLNEMKQHNVKRTDLDRYNKFYMAKVISLCDSIPLADSEHKQSLENRCKETVRKWAESTCNGNQGWNAAKAFIYDTAKGTSDGKSWSLVVDKYAEATFPWEHQGYTYRESERLLDLLVCVESEMLYRMYCENELHSQKEDAYFEQVVDDYVNNMVKENKTQAICQIPGANHISIERGSYMDCPKTETLKYNPECPIMSNQAFDVYAPCVAYSIIEKRHLVWSETFMVPSAALHQGSKFRNYYAGSIQKAIDNMMTAKEAEAIYDYYNKKGSKAMSFDEIMKNEAKVATSDEKKLTYSDSHASVMPLYGTKVTASGVWSNREDVYFSEVCNVEKKNHNDAFTSYKFGTFEYTDNGAKWSWRTEDILKVVKVTSHDSSWKGGFSE